MIDPLSAFATVKAGIAAGKQLHSMSKEIAGFFDSVDAAKKNHDKKKNSVFASANEEAMDTFLKRQAAIDAEAQLRELIIATRGYSQYQELLKLRKEIRIERKERERKERIEKEEMQEMVLLVFVSLLLLCVAGVAVVVYFGLIDPRDFL